MESDGVPGSKDKVDFFSLQASTATVDSNISTSSNINTSSGGKRISTLSFDPTKIRTTFLKDGPKASLEEEISKEGLLCQECGETCDSRKVYNIHMRRHTTKDGHLYEENNNNDDNVDENDWYQSAETAQPRKTYKIKQKYECSFCQRTFTNKHGIRYHMKMHNGDTPFQCTMCPKRFALGRNLYRHIKMCHQGHDENATELCSKLMQENNSHDNKMVIFTGEKPKPYKCAICSKQFRRLYRVKNHTRSHTGQKPFQCSVCSKLFSSSDNLYRHVKRIHNGGLPIHHLNKNIHHNNNNTNDLNSTLAKVEQFEETEEPESEEIAGGDYGSHTTIIQIDDGSGSTFSIPVQQNSSNELTFLHNPRQAEVYTVSGDDNNSYGNTPTYYIDLRSTQFAQADPLGVGAVQEHHQQQQLQSSSPRKHHHQQIHHEDNNDEEPSNTSPSKGAFQCSLCGFSFSSGPLLNKHISMHKLQLPTKCQICGKSFKAEAYLKRHMICHSGEKPFKCSLCPKAFNRQYRLNNHWRTHTGEKPYVCSVCGKSFAVSDNMYRHIKKIHRGVGLEYAVGLVKQIQDLRREKKYAELYGELEIDEEESKPMVAN